MFLLLLIAVFGEPLHKAIGTSTLIMALTAFSGTIGYMMHDFLNILYSAITALGSIIAGTTASRVANKLPEKKLSLVVGSIFIFVGMLMILLRGGLALQSIY